MSTPDPVILRTRGLSKEFRGFHAVRNVSLEIRRHSIHALIGPNGAGKTTCFNLLTTFLPASAATIEFNGRDITRSAIYAALHQPGAQRVDLTLPAADIPLTAAGKPDGNMVAPVLAHILGGELFFAFISAVAFATILAVVAGLTISASTSFAHDFFTNVIHHGKEQKPGEEVRVARITAFVVGAHTGDGGEDDGRHRGGDGHLDRQIDRHAAVAKDGGDEGHHDHAPTDAEQAGQKSAAQAEQHEFGDQDGF